MNYEKLFFGLSPEGLPNLHRLERVRIPSAGDAQLGEDAQQEIWEQLAAVRKLCSSLGWTPLIIELALISDARLRSELEEPHFTSFIVVSLPKAERAAKAYLSALRFMKGSEAGEIQIVPHPELFSSTTGLVDINFSDLSGDPCLSDISSELPDLTAETYVTGTRQGFILMSSPTRNLDEQVRVFGRALLSNVEADYELGNAGKLLLASRLVVVPFVRPHRVTDASGNPRHLERQLRRGVPGGALFLTVLPPKGSESIENLGRAVSWVFGEAALREVYTTLELELEERRVLEPYRRVLRVFGHGIANRLKAAGLVSLRAKANRLETLPAEEVKSALDMLWPVWGIGDLSRLAALSDGEMRTDWLAPSLREHLSPDGYIIGSNRLDAEDHVERVRQLVISLASALCAAFGSTSNVTLGIRWSGQPLEAHAVSSATTRALWPFEEGEFLAGTTLVTLGLFELLANAVTYLSGAGFSDDSQRWLDIDALWYDDDTLEVVVRHAALPGSWQRWKRVGAPQSKTVDEIQQVVESRLLSSRGKVVETEQFVPLEDTPGLEAKWRFRWRNIRWTEL
jgi:hypothetical protein